MARSATSIVFVESCLSFYPQCSSLSRSTPVLMPLTTQLFHLTNTSPSNRTPQRPPSSSQRSPKFSAALAPVVVSLKSVLNSWMTLPAQSFATSRVLSAKTTFSACSNLSVRPADFVKAYSFCYKAFVVNQGFFYINTHSTLSTYVKFVRK
jgi:hypothetical protein